MYCKLCNIFVLICNIVIVCKIIHESPTMPPNDLMQFITLIILLIVCSCSLFVGFFQRYEIQEDFLDLSLPVPSETTKVKNIQF